MSKLLKTIQAPFSDITRQQAYTLVSVDQSRVQYTIFDIDELPRKKPFMRGARGANHPRRV